MEDIDISLPEDVLTYKLLRRLPSSLDGIKQNITHSKNSKDIRPEVLLDHLKIHMNELKVSTSTRAESICTTMLTSEDKKCRSDYHYPQATHSRECCWAMYPEKREAHLKKIQEANISSLSTFLCYQPNLFVLESGSTLHMVADKQLFVNLDEGKGGMINTSCSANTLQIKGKGTISLKFRHSIFKLHNFLYVPKITVNLLSLRHLLLEQCTINFSVNHFVILKNGCPFLDGNYSHNLPVLNLEPAKDRALLSSAELLHKSLGHVSYRRIRNKLGIPVSAPETCKLCAVVKITRASFRTRTSRASKPLEEIHLDLIGPISPMSHRKHKYILTIVDSYSRFCAAIPIVEKDQVFGALSYAIDIESKRLRYYPSVIHSDQGTEFINSKLDEYCRTHVIRQRFSDAYTPQQNGLAKRFNRTILKSLRTIIFDSGLCQNL
jgi:hypothetical protein